MKKLIKILKLFGIKEDNRLTGMRLHPAQDYEVVMDCNGNPVKCPKFDFENKLSRAVKRLLEN